MKVGTIDLQIPLTPSLIEPVKKWLGTYIEREPATSYHPFVDEENRTLNMCSFAFPSFIGYVNVDDSTDFEARRLRKLGEDAIREVMARKRDELVIRNFEQTLHNLENIAIGAALRRPAERLLEPTMEYAR